MIDLKEVLARRSQEIDAYIDMMLDPTWEWYRDRHFSAPDPTTGQVQEVYDLTPFRGKVITPKTIEKVHVAGGESYVQYAQLVYRDVVLQPGDLLGWRDTRWVVMALLPHSWSYIPRCRVRLLQQDEVV